MQSTCVDNNIKVPGKIPITKIQQNHCAHYKALDAISTEQKADHHLKGTFLQLRNNAPIFPESWPHKIVHNTILPANICME